MKKKQSLTAKKLTSNQYSDTFQMQNELIINNFHLRIQFYGIWLKWGYIEVQNLEKYGK